MGVAPKLLGKPLGGPTRRSAWTNKALKDLVASWRKHEHVEDSQSRGQPPLCNVPLLCSFQSGLTCRQGSEEASKLLAEL